MDILQDLCASSDDEDDIYESLDLLSYCEKEEKEKENDNSFTAIQEDKETLPHVKRRKLNQNEEDVSTLKSAKKEILLTTTNEQLSSEALAEKVKMQQALMVKIAQEAKRTAKSVKGKSALRRESMKKIVKDCREADVNTKKKSFMKTSVLHKMEHCCSKNGPMKVLYDCVKYGIKAKVWIRRYKGLRGVITGYIAAFDLHMNLAMIDVTEVYTIETWMIGKPVYESKAEKSKDICKVINHVIDKGSETDVTVALKGGTIDPWKRTTSKAPLSTLDYLKNLTEDIQKKNKHYSPSELKCRDVPMGNIIIDTTSQSKVNHQTENLTSDSKIFNPSEDITVSSNGKHIMDNRISAERLSRKTSFISDDLWSVLQKIDLKTLEKKDEISHIISSVSSIHSASISNSLVVNTVAAYFGEVSLRKTSLHKTKTCSLPSTTLELHTSGITYTSDLPLTSISNSQLCTVDAMEPYVADGTGKNTFDDSLKLNACKNTFDFPKVDLDESCATATIISVSTALPAVYPTPISNSSSSIVDAMTSFFIKSSQNLPSKSNKKLGGIFLTLNECLPEKYFENKVVNVSYQINSCNDTVSDVLCNGNILPDTNEMFTSEASGDTQLQSKGVSDPRLLRKGDALIEKLPIKNKIDPENLNLTSVEKSVIFNYSSGAQSIESIALIPNVLHSFDRMKKGDKLRKLSERKPKAFSNRVVIELADLKDIVMDSDPEETNVGVGYTTSNDAILPDATLVTTASGRPKGNGRRKDPSLFVAHKLEERIKILTQRDKKNHKRTLCSEIAAVIQGDTVKLSEKKKDKSDKILQTMREKFPTKNSKITKPHAESTSKLNLRKKNIKKLKNLTQEDIQKILLSIHKTSAADEDESKDELIVDRLSHAGDNDSNYTLGKKCEKNGITQDGECPESSFKCGYFSTNGLPKYSGSETNLCLSNEIHNNIDGDILPKKEGDIERNVYNGEKAITFHNVSKNTEEIQNKQNMDEKSNIFFPIIANENKLRNINTIGNEKSIIFGTNSGKMQHKPSVEKSKYRNVKTSHNQLDSEEMKIDLDSGSTIVTNSTNDREIIKTDHTKDIFLNKLSKDDINIEKSNFYIEINSCRDLSCIEEDKSLNLSKTGSDRCTFVFHSIAKRLKDIKCSRPLPRIESKILKETTIQMSPLFATEEMEGELSSANEELNGNSENQLDGAVSLQAFKVIGRTSIDNPSVDDHELCDREDRVVNKVKKIKKKKLKKEKKKELREKVEINRIGSTDNFNDNGDNDETQACSMKSRNEVSEILSIPCIFEPEKIENIYRFSDKNFNTGKEFSKSSAKDLCNNKFSEVDPDLLSSEIKCATSKNNIIINTSSISKMSFDVERGLKRDRGVLTTMNEYHFSESASNNNNNNSFKNIAEFDNSMVRSEDRCVEFLGFDKEFSVSKSISCAGVSKMGNQDMISSDKMVIPCEKLVISDVDKAAIYEARSSPGSDNLGDKNSPLESSAFFNDSCISFDDESKISESESITAMADHDVNETGNNCPVKRVERMVDKFAGEKPSREYCGNAFHTSSLETHITCKEGSFEKETAIVETVQQCDKKGKEINEFQGISNYERAIDIVAEINENVIVRDEIINKLLESDPVSSTVSDCKKMVNSIENMKNVEETNADTKITTEFREANVFEDKICNQAIEIKQNIDLASSITSKEVDAVMFVYSADTKIANNAESLAMEETKRKIWPPGEVGCKMKEQNIYTFSGCESEELEKIPVSEDGNMDLKGSIIPSIASQNEATGKNVFFSDKYNDKELKKNDFIMRGNGMKVIKDSICSTAKVHSKEEENESILSKDASEKLKKVFDTNNKKRDKKMENCIDTHDANKKTLLKKSNHVTIATSRGVILGDHGDISAEVERGKLILSTIEEKNVIIGTHLGRPETEKSMYLPCTDITWMGDDYIGKANKVDVSLSDEMKRKKKGNISSKKNRDYTEKKQSVNGNKATSITISGILHDAKLNEKEDEAALCELNYIAGECSVENTIIDRKRNKNVVGNVDEECSQEVIPDDEIGISSIMNIAFEYCAENGVIINKKTGQSMSSTIDKGGIERNDISGNANNFSVINNMNRDSDSHNGDIDENKNEISVTSDPDKENCGKEEGELTTTDDEETKITINGMDNKNVKKLNQESKRKQHQNLYKRKQDKFSSDRTIRTGSGGRRIGCVNGKGEISDDIDDKEVTLKSTVSHRKGCKSSKLRINCNLISKSQNEEKAKTAEVIVISEDDEDSYPKWKTHKLHSYCSIRDKSKKVSAKYKDVRQRYRMENLTCDDLRVKLKMKKEKNKLNEKLEREQYKTMSRYSSQKRSLEKICKEERSDFKINTVRCRKSRRKIDELDSDDEGRCSTKSRKPTHRENFFVDIHNEKKPSAHSRRSDFSSNDTERYSFISRGSDKREIFYFDRNDEEKVTPKLRREIDKRISADEVTCSIKSRRSHSAHLRRSEFNSNNEKRHSFTLRGSNKTEIFSFDSGDKERRTTKSRRAIDKKNSCDEVTCSTKLRKLHSAHLGISGYTSNEEERYSLKPRGSDKREMCSFDSDDEEKLIMKSRRMNNKKKTNNKGRHYTKSRKSSNKQEYLINNINEERHSADSKVFDSDSNTEEKISVPARRSDKTEKFPLVMDDEEKIIVKSKRNDKSEKNETHNQAGKLMVEKVGSRKSKETKSAKVEETRIYAEDMNKIVDRSGREGFTSLNIFQRRRLSHEKLGGIKKSGEGIQKTPVEYENEGLIGKDEVDELTEDDMLINFNDKLVCEKTVKPRDKLTSNSNESPEKSFLARRLIRRQQKEKERELLQKQKDQEYDKKLVREIASFPLKPSKEVKGSIFKRRHVNQLFIRGDNIVMITYEIP